MGSPFQRLAFVLFCVLAAVLDAHALPPQNVSAITLTITAGGVPVSSVPAHTVATLTATVLSSGTPVSPGLVNFCDATATFCTGAHLLGSAQIQANGQAIIRFTPGPGAHGYKAVFVGTTLVAGSSSVAVPFVVSGIPSGASVVGIQASGGQGDYTLLGTVAPAGLVSPAGQVTFLDTDNGNYQLGAATLAPTGTGNTSFLQSYSYRFPLGSGVRPGYVATGDFDKDGHQDVLFVSPNLGLVETLLGKGDGTFTTMSAAVPGLLPEEPPIVADFNSDGKLDFVVRTTAGLAVFLGNGDGTFSAGSTFTITHLPTFTVADLNDDGIPDLLIGNDASLYAYLGDGSGRFAAPIVAFQGIIGTIVSLRADYNGDGIPDLLLISDPGAQMLLGNGDGTFRGGPANPLIGNNLKVGVTSGAVADVNDDGVMDAIVGTNFFQPPYVLLGNGDATFNVLAPDDRLDSATNAVTLADFNGDGILDLVLPYLYGGETNVYIGKGDGTFTPDIYSPGLAYFTSESLATADFNGDGQADIAEVFNGDYNQLVVLLSQSASTAAGYAYNISPVGTGYHSVEAFYGGDANNPAGTSQTIALLAQQVPTNLTLTALPAAGSLQGQSVTLTASLDQFLAQNHNASGLVTFTSNGNVLGTAQIANGVASLVTSSLPAGLDSLEADYAGDLNFEDAGSTPFAYTVTPRQPQTITFPQPAAPAYASLSVLLNATASSGLAVSYSVVSGPASLNGSVLTPQGNGTVVVEADQAGSANFVAASPVLVSFPVATLTVAVGSPSITLTTTLSFATAGSLKNIALLTQGVSNLDYTVAPGGTCSPGTTYTTGQHCTVAFTLKPSQPGRRAGGITLTDSGQTVLASTLLTAIGTGPLVTFDQPPIIAVASAIPGTDGIAFDAAGNMFLGSEPGFVYKLTKSSGYTARQTLAGSYSDPTGIAVDGNGNVFIVDVNGHTLTEVFAASNYTATRVIGSAFKYPVGAAIDSEGNVFVCDKMSGTITEFFAASNYIQTSVTSLGVGMGPEGLAFDSADNLFVANEGRNASVLELTAAGNHRTVTIVVPGLTYPESVAVDAAGNLFVYDDGPFVLYKFLAAANYKASLDLDDDFLSSIALDGAGNLFASQATPGNFGVAQIALTTPETLDFADTLVGHTSTDSPQAVTLYNDGNADLHVAGIAGGANPNATPGFPFSSTCGIVQQGSTAAYVVPSGGGCTQSVSFSPIAAGPDSGFLAFTDDNLNQVAARQAVPLNGLGLTLAPSIKFTIPNHTFGDPPFAVAAISNSPASIAYSVVGGPATISGATVTLTGAGPVVLLAAQPASGAYSAGSQTATFAVGKQSQTIDFPAPASPVNVGSAPLPLAASASSGLPVVFSVLSGPGVLNGNALTVTAAGTVIVAADQPGNSNESAALEVTRSVLGIGRLVGLSLTATPNPVFLRNPVALSVGLATGLAASGGSPTGAVTFLDGTTPLGTVAVSGAAVTLITSSLGPGVHSVSATYSGDSVFAPAATSAVSVTVQDFALAATNANLTIVHGGTATYNLLLSSVGGVGTASTVALSLSGQPDRSEFTFTPQVVPGGSGTTPVTLVIHTPNYPTGPFTALWRGRSSGVSLACLALGALLLPFGRRLRAVRRYKWLLPAALIAALGIGASALAGCGSGWRTQKYTIQVTATSGQLSRTSTLTLTSQCRDGQTACPIE